MRTTLGLRTSLTGGTIDHGVGLTIRNLTFYDVFLSSQKGIFMSQNTFYDAHGDENKTS
jgi:hypothetical protein